MDTTIVTAVVDIGREHFTPPFNRSFDTYLNFMKSCVLKLENPMVIFIQEEYADEIKQERKDYPNTIVIPTTLDHYRLSSHRELIRDILESKRYKEYIKDITHCPEISSCDYNIAVNNKIEFMYRVACKNPFNTKYFAWLDAGFGHSTIYIPDHWTMIFDSYTSKTRPDTLTIQKIYDIPKNLHPLDFFKLHKDYIVGGFFMGTKRAIKNIHQQYYPYIIDTMGYGLIDDDQYYMAMLCSTFPELFTCFQATGWFACIFNCVRNK
jgi:protein YibB